ncbi:hypothetical protein Tco_1211592 [Tanacetum coccineum]
MLTLEKGRKSVKSSKGEPSVHKDPNFEDLDDFVDVDNTLELTLETERLDQDEGVGLALNKQKEKEKGVEIRNVEDTERTRPTSTRSKFKMLAKDEEVARKVQEEWEAEEEKKRLAKEEATKKSAEKVPRMDDLLKHVGAERKHSDLKDQKTFEEIQIKELNKDPKKKRVIKETPREEDTAKDLFHLYDLVMKQYSEITPEDIDVDSFGRLEDYGWNPQQRK